MVLWGTAVALLPAGSNRIILPAMSTENYPASLPPPGPYLDFKRRYPAVVEAYEGLGKTCHSQGPLPPKLRELVKLGIALGAGLEGASRAHARLAVQAGSSVDEIMHAVLLTTTTLGFPAMMRSYSWIHDEIGTNQS